MKTLFILLTLFIGELCIAQTEKLDRAKKLIYKDPAAAVDLAADYLVGDGYLSAKAYSITAKAYEVRGMHTTAYQAYTQGLNKLYAADTLDHYLEYAIFNNMAMIAAESNQYEISSELYGRAAEAAERYVKYEPEVAGQYGEQFLPNKMKFYQANAMYDAGDLEGALDIYLELDKQFKTDVKDVNTFALLRNEYGLNAKAVKDFVGAEYYFQSIIDIEGVSGYYKQSALHNLALVKMEMGDSTKALELFESAINMEGAHETQYFISMMDKGELLLHLNRNAEAVGVLEQAVALGVDLRHDLRLMNVYYLLERASKKLNIKESNRYGDVYQGLVDSHIRRQGELIAQEKARVFSMTLNEVKHKEKLAELERQYFYRVVFNVVLFVILAIAITYLVVWCSIKINIRRTIMQ